MLNRKIEVGKCYMDQSGAIWKIIKQTRDFTEEFIGDVIKDSKKVRDSEYSGSWFNSYGQYGRGDYEDFDKADFVSEFIPIKTILPLP